MNTKETAWRESLPGEWRSSNEVHVWRAFLNQTRLQREKLLKFLSADELARAAKFHFESDRNRYILARGILRTILGHYLSKSPDLLHFEYTSHGKPKLSTNAGYDALDFNLTHSGEFAMYAIAKRRNIGIDIEKIRSDIAIAQIADKFFSPPEISFLQGIDKDKLPDVFFQLWTRKEAFIKATGNGFSLPIEHVDVSLTSERILSPIILSGNYKENAHWYVQDLFPGKGYTAAMVVEGSDWELSCWNYDF
jgi:4'-phosphopantetheinyl transferase